MSYLTTDYTHLFGTQTPSLYLYFAQMMMAAQAWSTVILQLWAISYKYFLALFLSLIYPIILLAGKCTLTIYTLEYFLVYLGPRFLNYLYHNKIFLVITRNTRKKIVSSINFVRNGPHTIFQLLKTSISVVPTGLFWFFHFFFHGIAKTKPRPSRYDCHHYYLLLVRSVLHTHPRHNCRNQHQRGHHIHRSGHD